MSYANLTTRWIYEHSPIFFQNFCTTSWGWKLRQKKYGYFFKKNFNFLQKAQWQDKQVLRELQNEKLRKLIEYAYENVPYYKNIFDRRHLKPSDVNKIEDLTKLPLLNKDTVRKKWGDLLSRKYSQNKAIIYHTSGTTGKPITVHISKDCYEREYAFRWLHYSWGNVQRGEKTATVAGHPVVPIGQKEPPFWRYNWSENQLFFSSQHIAQNTLPYYVSALKAFQPVMIHGYPSSIFLIAYYLNKNGISAIRPRALFTASETLLAFQKKTIEDAFGCKVFNWYGNTEMVAHATECEYGGMHNQLLHSVIEIVNKEGEIVTDGEEGIIVGTGLDNLAMPLIRYKVGDVAALMDGKCACGRGYPLLKRIVGRVEDYIVTPEGRYVGRLDHVFKHDLHIIEAQLIQETLDSLQVKIVKDSGYSEKDTEKIIKELHNRVGNSMRFDFKFVSEIPKEPNAKFRFVISKIGNHPVPYRDKVLTEEYQIFNPKAK